MNCDALHCEIRWNVKKITSSLISSFLTISLIFLILGINQAEASISFRSSTSVNKQTNSSSCTISKHAGTIKDDVMIAAFQFDKGSSVTPPTGWKYLITGERALAGTHAA